MTDFVSLLDQHARTQPTRECLRAGGKTWTYADLAEATRRAAAVLRAKGVGPGDRVALLCLNTPGFIFALFGAWRLGAAVVPVNHKLQAPEVDYILAHAQTTVCVVDASLMPVARRVQHPTTWLTTDGAAGDAVSFDNLLAAASTDDVADTDTSTGTQQAFAAPGRDTLAEVLYTSGTTGQPKGCQHSHGNVFHAALCAAAATSITHKERTLIAMPLWHSSPLNNWMLGTLLMGGTVVLLREYAPKAFLDILESDRITFTFGAPIAFLAPLSVVPDVQHYDFSAMRLWAYGGGPLSADMARKLADSYRSDRFMQVYGMTESGPLGTVLYPEEAVAKAGSIGRSTTPGVALALRRADGSLCSVDEIGEIHLRSPAMMQGYLGNPAASAAAFDAQGWYRSGDLAHRDAAGFLFIVDRLKDMIITGGENVYSKEVEDALSAHPDVQDVAVIGRPHPEWGETVVATLVLRPGRTLDEDGLRSYLAPRLARYKIPRVYELHTALPRTATGKLLKHVLRQPLAHGAAAGHQQQANSAAAAR